MASVGSHLRMEPTLWTERTLSRMSAIGFGALCELADTDLAASEFLRYSASMALCSLSSIAICVAALPAAAAIVSMRLPTLPLRGLTKVR